MAVYFSQTASSVLGDVRIDHSHHAGLTVTCNGTVEEYGLCVVDRDCVDHGLERRVSHMYTRNGGPHSGPEMT